jgi:hypothetical protein
MFLEFNLWNRRKKSRFKKTTREELLWVGSGIIRDKTCIEKIPYIYEVTQAHSLYDDTYQQVFPNISIGV